MWPEYVFAGPGERCPTNYITILDEEICGTAAQALNLLYQDCIIPADKTMCYITQPNSNCVLLAQGHVEFSAAGFQGGGSTWSATARYVCRKAPFIVGASGSTSCPIGYKTIQSLTSDADDRCQIAAVFLGMNYGVPQDPTFTWCAAKTSEFKVTQRLPGGGDADLISPICELEDAVKSGAEIFQSFPGCAINDLRDRTNTKCDARGFVEGGSYSIRARETCTDPIMNSHYRLLLEAE